MLKKIEKGNNVFYQCRECNFVYKKRIWANKCEKWCKKNKSCNLNIIKYSVG